MDPIFTLPPDDSLAPLSWLQNFDIATLGGPPRSSGELLTPSYPGQEGIKVNPNAVLNMRPHGGSVPGSVPLVFTCTTKPPRHSSDLQGTCDKPPTMATMDRMAFKSNPSMKPPYTYVTLICMALKESQGNKCTVAGIYDWITENFMYYRVTDHSAWQTAIGSALSKTKYFQKIARSKVEPRGDEPGKGAFWRIDPECNGARINSRGMYKKRCIRPTCGNVAPPQKHMRPYMGLPVKVKLVIGDMEVPATVTTESAETPTAIMYHRNEELPTALTGADFTWNAFMPHEIEWGTVRVKVENDDQGMPNMMNPGDLSEWDTVRVKVETDDQGMPNMMNPGDLSERDTVRMKVETDDQGMANMVNPSDLSKMNTVCVEVETDDQGMANMVNPGDLSQWDTVRVKVENDDQGVPNMTNPGDLSELNTVSG